MKRDLQQLRTEWLSLRASKNGLHALDVAERLGVTECELLALACGTHGDIRATRLAADWAKLIADLPGLGLVRTVTRNPHAVIEVDGTYGNVEFFGAMGQSVSSIDLRIFVNRWRYGFAVHKEKKRGTSRGFQFFDGSGRAVHKLYLRDRSDATAFEALARTYTSSDQEPTQLVDPPEPAPPVRADSQIDVTGLRSAWRAMTDSHQFFGLLRQFGVARTQALRLVGEELAVPLSRTSLERTLYGARDAELPFMIFVGNAGVIQIHTGVVRKIAPMGPWINVLDPGFDLHVRTDQIDQAWLVRKPTSDGIVTSLEIYDVEGQQIALLVGKRKPGMAESGAWRELVEALPRESVGTIPSTMTGSPP